MKKTEKRIRADLLPGILTMILLPLVAKGQKTEVDLGKYSWFPDGSFQYDFFMYWKSIVFLILVAAMLLVLIERSLLRGSGSKTGNILFHYMYTRGLQFFPRFCLLTKHYR